MGCRQANGRSVNDDAALVGRCVAGDERAFRELVQRYQARVYSLAYRMLRIREDAEDITQETFVRMFRAASRYDPERPFSSWLFTIASRLCIDHMRRRRVPTISMFQREHGSTEEWTLELPDQGPGPVEETEQLEEEQRMRALVDRLPEHYRIVVMLRHQEDLSYEEIAEALDMPLGTIKARIHRARGLLRELLERGEA